MNCITKLIDNNWSKWPNWFKNKLSQLVYLYIDYLDVVDIKCLDKIVDTVLTKIEQDDPYYNDYLSEVMRDVIDEINKSDV